MSSTYSLKDYKATYFKYKTLDKIHGQPTVDNLLMLFRQLKRNIQCVTCVLSSGQLGYLRLILTQEAYENIPQAETFVHPKNPGPFRLVIDSTNLPPKRTRAQTVGTASETDNPSVTFTAAIIAQQKATHEESLRLYLECQEVEQALRVQLIEAVNLIYLDALCNSDTDMIHESLPKIMDHLMKNYGQIMLEDMHDKEQEVISLTYDPNTPVNTVFSIVNKFCNLCILTDQPKTDAQLTNVAYIIFNKPRFLWILSRLETSKLRTRPMQTSKKHLRKEYNELRQVGALAIQHSKLQPQAHLAQNTNEITNQISSNISNDLRNTIMDAIMALNQSEESEDTVPKPQVNSTARSTTDVQHLCKLVTDLQEEVRSLRNPQDSNNTNKAEFDPRTGKLWCRYYHTHGCCNHWGRNCKNKGQNHKDEAMFCNRMGGSNKNSLPIQD